MTFRASTYGELDDAFVAAAEHRDRMVLIEAVVPRIDVPDLLERAGPTYFSGRQPAAMSERSVRRQRPQSAPAPHDAAI